MKQPEPTKAPSTAVKSGLVLGKSAKTDYVNKLMAEGEVIEEQSRPIPGVSNVPASAAVKRESVHIKIEEKLVLLMEREGGLKNMEIKGEFTIVIIDPSSAKIRLKLRNDYNKTYPYRIHPNVNKNMFNNEGILGLSDPSRSFPCGTPLGVLKWRQQAKDDSSIPLQINCWPSLGGPSTTVVNLEYELLNRSLELHDVDIIIPIPGGHAPVVNSGDGNYHYENKGFLHWTMHVIDSSNPSGSLEFTIPYSGDSSALFPVNVSFTSPKTFANLTAEQVLGENGAPVPFSVETSLSTERFVIE